VVTVAARNRRKTSGTSQGNGSLAS
jgi:hypothetical protein